MPHWFGELMKTGNYGVDIFLLLSGLGCYYSLSKDGQDLSAFYRKRFFRIFVPYLLIYIPINLIYLSLGGKSLGECLLSLTTMDYWLLHKGAWFVSLIIVLYLAAPLIHTAVSGKWKWGCVAVMVLLIAGLCSIPIQDNSDTSVLHNVQWAFSRAPGFILGMAVAQGCKDRKTVTAAWPILLALLYYPVRLLVPTCDGRWLVAPLIASSFIVVIKMLRSVGFVDRFLTFMGNISLESYLTNISLNTLLVFLIPAFISSPIFWGRILEYSFVIVGGILAAYAVNVLSKRLVAVSVSSK